MAFLKAISFKQILLPLIPYLAIIVTLPVFHFAWLTVLTYHAGMIIVLLLINRSTIPQPIFKRTKLGILILIVAAAVGACGGVLLYLFWPHLSLPADINVYLRSIGLSGGTWLAFAVYFSLINPFLEEFYWRGFLGSAARGLTINDMLFSGYHLLVLAGLIGNIWLLIVFAGLTFAAWFWRQMNRLDGGLLASIISHLAADTAIVWTIYYFSVK